MGHGPCTGPRLDASSPGNGCLRPLPPLARSLEPVVRMLLENPSRWPRVKNYRGRRQCPLGRWKAVTLKDCPFDLRDNNGNANLPLPDWLSQESRTCYPHPTPTSPGDLLRVTLAVSSLPWEAQARADPTQRPCKFPGQPNDTWVTCALRWEYVCIIPEDRQVKIFLDFLQEISKKMLSNGCLH